MIERISTKDMTRSEWLEERRKSIGGSELGAILGLNPYASPYSVWANKAGKVPDPEPNEAMRQGSDLEEYVAQRFTEKSGLKVERVNFLLRNTDYPHIHANIDRRIVGERAGLECKTASALNAAKFAGGEFPASYYAQCVAYMAVTGYSRWYLAVLVLGRDFKVFQMTREPETELPKWCESSVFVGPLEFKSIRDAAAEFWEYVESETEPPADGLKATGEALAAVYPTANGARVNLFGCEDIVSGYLEARSRVKEWENEAERYANMLKQRLGENEAGSCGDHSVSWRNQSRSTFDVQAFRAEHRNIDLTPYYKTSAFRRFTVKEERK